MPVGNTVGPDEGLAAGAGVGGVNGIQFLTGTFKKRVLSNVKSPLVYNSQILAPLHHIRIEMYPSPLLQHIPSPPVSVITTLYCTRCSNRISSKSSREVRGLKRLDSLESIAYTTLPSVVSSMLHDVSPGFAS